VDVRRRRGFVSGASLRAQLEGCSTQTVGVSSASMASALSVDQNADNGLLPPNNLSAQQSADSRSAPTFDASHPRFQHMTPTTDIFSFVIASSFRYPVTMTRILKPGRPPREPATHRHEYLIGRARKALRVRQSNKNQLRRPNPNTKSTPNENFHYTLIKISYAKAPAQSRFPVGKPA
jgi:hypothetical protein